MMLNPIKKARLLKGMQQKEFANLLGISQVSVSKWEHGKTFPKAKRLKQVADTLGIPIEELLEDEERVV